MSTAVAEPAGVPAGPATSARRLGRARWTRLLGPSPVTAREVVLVAAALALLGARVFYLHIRHGGFYFDDWGVLSVVHFPPHHGDGPLAALWPYYSQRPGEVAWYALVDSTLGFHASLQLTLAAVSLWAEVVVIGVLMRVVGVAALHAALICALVLVFPFSDSQWLWAIMSMSSLATAVGLVGVLVALRALRTPHRRGLALHALSLGLYVVSVLSYEVFGFVGMLVGLLYVARVGWARARARWAVDVLALAATLAVAKLVLPRDLASPRSVQGVGGVVHHVGLIVRQGASILAQAAEPFGSPPRSLVLVVLAVVIGAGAAVWWLARPQDPGRRALGRWLGLAAAGLVVAGGAWAIYAPAIDYYSPGAQGTGNRVNGLAGVGLVMCLYATGAVAVTLLTSAGARLRGRAALALPQRGAAAALALAGAVWLGAGYVHRDLADTRVWNRAIAEQHQVIATIRSVLPNLPRRATLYTFHHPTLVASWIGVYRYPWDLTGALRHTYGRRGVAGVPVNRGTEFACTGAGLYPTNDGYHRGNGALYGQAYFVDVRGRLAVAVSNRATCERLVATLHAGARIS